MVKDIKKDLNSDEKRRKTEQLKKESEILEKQNKKLASKKLKNSGSVFTECEKCSIDFINFKVDGESSRFCRNCI